MPCKCNVSLHQKIAVRSGRLQLIVAELAEVARFIDENVTEVEDVEPDMSKLMELASACGPRWLDETSMLLKELYNRERGP